MILALLRDFCLTPSMAMTDIVLSDFSFSFNKSAISFVQTDMILQLLYQQQVGI